MPESTESESEPASHAGGGPAARPAIVGDLEQRIAELEQLPEARFGTFTALDWILCAAGALLLPYLLFAWFWP